MIGDLVVSWIRTGVTLAVGWVVAVIATNSGIVIDEHSEAVLVALFTALVAFLWYLLVRLLEHKWAWLGVLLGVPRKPTYTPPPPPP